MFRAGKSTRFNHETHCLLVRVIGAVTKDVSLQTPAFRVEWQLAINLRKVLAWC
jgi:hypothetical protein